MICMEQFPPDFKEKLHHPVHQAEQAWLEAANMPRFACDTNLEHNQENSEQAEVYARTFRCKQFLFFIFLI